jgi:hypothetical protein
MTIKLYDEIMLKCGKTAHIVEIWEADVAYEADIDEGDGEYTTETIKYTDIAHVLSVHGSHHRVAQ